MYKVLVHDIQFFDDKYTIGDVITFFAERADLLTESADMLFYCDFQPDRLSVITKKMSDQFKTDQIPFNAAAKDYMCSDYPFISQTEAETFVQAEAPQDTPVVDENGRPQYVILAGYKEDSNKSKKHYICRVLAGKAYYHFSVNADMTVSCNCMLRECGQIGNLREQSLKDIYYSEKAQNMRQAFFDGFLHSVSCAYRCDQVQSVSEQQGRELLGKSPMAQTLMFETTSYCNFKCKDCYNQYIKKCNTTIEDAERVAKEAQLNGIKIMYLFKYGETFCDKDIYEKIKIIRHYNPNIFLTTSTNGALLHLRNNMDAALLLDSIVFSLDGVDNKTAQAFQINGDFKTVYNNMRELVRRRENLHPAIRKPTITWKYVLFHHNDNRNHLLKLFHLAKKAEADILQFVIGFNAEIPSNAIQTSLVLRYYRKKYIHYLDGGKCLESFELKRNTGLYKDNTQWKYYEYGHYNSATGIVKRADDQKWYYVEKGLLSNATGVSQTIAPLNREKGWYVKNGCVDRSFKGLASDIQEPDHIYLIKKGVVNRVSGLHKIDGVLMYFEDGEFQNITGLILDKNNNQRKYVEDGVFTAVTGIVRQTDTDQFYFVDKGVLNNKATGLAKNLSDNKWYYVENGIYAKKTGAAKRISDGKWFYARNGIYTKATGLAKRMDNDDWYYFKSGRYCKYTGKAAKIGGDGTKYNVVNGKMIP